MDTATYSFYVDWNNNGLYTHASSDISAYVLGASWYYYGKDSYGNSSRVGQLQIKLDNSTSIFSPYNAASPVYGKILPNRRVKVVMTLFAVPVTMYVGFLQSIVPTVGERVSVSTADLTAYGPLSRTQNAQVHLALQSNKTTGYLADLVLDGMSYPAADATLDTGLSTIGRYFIRDKQSAAEALRELEAAECGLIHETKDGKIQFEARGHRLASPHDSAVRTYGTGTYHLWNLTQQDHLRSIYNVVEADVRTFNVTDSVVLVTISDVRNNLGGTPPIVPAASPTGSLTVVMPYPDPNGGSQGIAVSSWGIVDYEANTAADGSGTDITTDVSASKVEYADRIEVTFTNVNASDAHIILLRVHGTAVVEGTPIKVSSEDATSIAAYGRQVYPSPSHWLTQMDEGQDYCDHVLAVSKDPRPRITFQLKANYDWTHLEEAQRLDISDRLHIHATLADFGLAIDGDFFVEYLQHTVDQARMHTVTIEAEAVSTHTWAASGTSYTSKVLPGDTGPPDDLQTVGWPMGYTINVGCVAWKYNATIDLAEFRAKRYDPGTVLDAADLRTPDEGGSLVHDGTDNLIITDMYANYNGINYQWVSGGSPAVEGIWYFAFRLRNDQGWSVWSDGNPTPSKVKDHIQTGGDYDSGPPEDWTVWLEAGPAPNTVLVKCTRPVTNGNRILFIGWQIRDISIASVEAAFQNLDDDSGPSDTVYDGSAIDHTLNADRDRLTRNSGSGIGTAASGDLLMIDVRGSAFSRDYTVFMQIAGVGSNYIQLGGPTWLPFGIRSDYRVKVVACPWTWATDGYLGGQPGMGWNQTEYWNILNADGTTGDTTSVTFSSAPIQIPAGLTLADLRGRAFIQNAYSRSDGGIQSDLITDTSSSGYEVILTDAATVAVDARLSDSTPRKVYYLLLTGAVGATRVLGNPTGAKHRQPMAFVIRQPNSSPYSALGWTLDTKYRLGSDVSEVTPSSTASQQDWLGVIYDGYDDKFDVVSFVRGYQG